MKIAVLLCLPAWCHGEHGLPRPSLVQVSSRGTAHAKAVADSMSSTLAGFQKFTDDLVDQYKKQEPPADSPAQSESYTSLGDETGIKGHNTTKNEMGDDTRGAVEKVLSYIDSFFANAVLAHDIDKGTMQNCANKVCSQTCLADVDEQTVVNEAERLTGQVVIIQKCLEEHGQEQDACVDWDLFRKREDTQLPGCVYSPVDDEFCHQTVAEGDIEFEKGDLCDNKIKADQDAEAEQLDAMEDCLEDMHDWLYTTKPMSDACLRGVGEANLKCQQDVEEYHAAHCEYVEVLETQCNNYDSCVQGCNSDCDQAQCDEIDIKSQARMADNETGERIKCLLKTLLNETVIDKTEGLAACTNTAAKSRYTTWASYFELTCEASADTPSYPPAVPCAERNQAVSLSTGYMLNLMTNVVPNLETTDQNNPCVTDAPAWNSCASVHKCTAVSRATDEAQDFFQTMCIGERTCNNAR